MTDKEILQYYSEHINTNYEWYEIDGRFFSATPECEDFSYCELSGSDILFGIKPHVIEHIKYKPAREALRKIIENE